jgi:multidrug efflux pump subunit AcrA (membrane-fusion protein)
VEVTAQTPGTVRRVFVHEGQGVRPGEVLAVLEDPDVEREWTEATARRDLARQASQVAQAAGDPSVFRQQLTALRREEATLELLAGRRAAAAIRSPQAGVVLTPRLEERVGEVLSRGAPFCVVGALDPLEAEILVPEDRVMNVAHGQPVYLKPAALPGRRFRARVTRVGVAAQTHDGRAYFPVVCVIENSRGLFRPGQGGWAKISLGRRPLGYILVIRAWDQARLWWWRLW